MMLQQLLQISEGEEDLMAAIAECCCCLLLLLSRVIDRPRSIPFALLHRCYCCWETDVAEGSNLQLR